jgi:uncharacterized protein YegL
MSKIQLEDNTEKDLKTTLSEAVKEGQISQGSFNLICGDLNQNIISGSNGMLVDDIQSTAVTLITLLIDNSGSIDGSGLTQEIIDGQEMIIEALKGTKKKDDILISAWLFNDNTDVLNSYLPVDDTEKINKGYRPNGGTKLYDTAFDAMSANVAYAQKLRANGTPVQSIVVILTDGEDTSSTRRANAVKTLAKDLLKTENFVLAYVGVGNCDHDQISKEMGFPAFLKGNATPSDVRKLLKMVSKSLVKQSATKITDQSNNAFFLP